MEQATLGAGAGYPGVQHACHNPHPCSSWVLQWICIGQNPPHRVFDPQPGSTPCARLLPCYSVSWRIFPAGKKSRPLLHPNTASSWHRQHPLAHQGLSGHCRQCCGCQAGSSAPLCCRKPLWKEGIVSCSLAMGSNVSLCSGGAGSVDGDHPSPEAAENPHPCLAGMRQHIPA